MCRLVIAGERRAGLSHEECVAYLREEHVPKVRRLPNLKRYKSGAVTDPDADYDVLQRLKFHGEADRSAAMASEEWTVVRADMEEFLDPEGTAIMAVADERLH